MKHTSNFNLPNQSSNIQNHSGISIDVMGNVVNVPITDFVRIYSALQHYFEHYSDIFSSTSNDFVREVAKENMDSCERLFDTVFSAFNK